MKVKMKNPSELNEGEFYELKQPWSPMIVVFAREYSQLSVTVVMPGLHSDRLLNLYFEDEASADDLSKSMLVNGAQYN